MKAPLLFLAAAAAVSLTSCSNTSMEIESNPVAGVDYSAYETYEWVPLDRKAAGDLTDEDKQLRASFVSEVDQIMARRGFTKSSQGKADLLVYARGIRAAGISTLGRSPDLLSDPEYPVYYQPGDATSQWLGRTGYQTTNTQISARFVISEPATDKVVWRGQAVVTIDDKRQQRLAERDARQVARKLMDGFPPK